MEVDKHTLREWLSRGYTMTFDETVVIAFPAKHTCVNDAIAADDVIILARPSGNDWESLDAETTRQACIAVLLMAKVDDIIVTRVTPESVHYLLNEPSAD